MSKEFDFSEYCGTLEDHYGVTDRVETAECASCGHPHPVDSLKPAEDGLTCAGCIAEGQKRDADNIATANAHILINAMCEISSSPDWHLNYTEGDGSLMTAHDFLVRVQAHLGVRACYKRSVTATLWGGLA